MEQYPPMQAGPCSFSRINSRISSKSYSVDLLLKPYAFKCDLSVDSYIDIPCRFDRKSTMVLYWKLLAK